MPYVSPEKQFRDHVRKFYGRNSFESLVNTESFLTRINEELDRLGLVYNYDKLKEIFESVHGRIDTEQKHIDAERAVRLINGKKFRYYSKRDMPKLPRQDNKSYVNKGSGGSWTIRYPKKVRKTAWKRFHKLFPRYDPKVIAQQEAEKQAERDLRIKKAEEANALALAKEKKKKALNPGKGKKRKENLK